MIDEYPPGETAILGPTYHVPKTELDETGEPIPVWLWTATCTQPHPGHTRDSIPWCPLTITAELADRIAELPMDARVNFWRVQREGLKLQMEALGCHHDLPEIPLPERMAPS